jgi:cardiolipin synthase
MEWLALSAVVLLVWFLIVVLFSPRIDYRASTRLPLGSPDLLRIVRAMCQASVQPGNAVAVLADGVHIYPAMRDAILAAEFSINLEAYIYEPGHAADLIGAALADRARAGVEVRVVVDAIGSRKLKGETLARLREAGCKVGFYQPATWYRLHRINNRTHRELLIVDGRVAIVGGAGIADWWWRETDGEPAWRDTSTRIEGPIVAALQGVFAENWLECEGEILTSAAHWPHIDPAGETDAMLVKSSPADRATVSRVVYQLLLEGAATAIDITTPYFLPDKALRRVLMRAARRGVRVRVLVPGHITDQKLVRLASRRMYGELLEASVRIFEYQPAMIHVKSLMVDGMWSLIGTTNVDNRSFEHNDEVNVAFREAAVTARLSQHFTADLARSQEVTLAGWKTRTVGEKLLGPICWILERQQ